MDVLLEGFRPVHVYSVGGNVMTMSAVMNLYSRYYGLV